MEAKFCLDCSEPLVDGDSEAVSLISSELDAFDCGCCDVPELGGGNWWVFSVNVDQKYGTGIAEWVRFVLRVIEKHTRRLSDDEWIVILDRGSIFK
jgi:hypothetical protein